MLGYLIVYSPTKKEMKLLLKTGVFEFYCNKFYRHQRPVTCFYSDFNWYENVIEMRNFADREDGLLKSAIIATDEKSIKI